MYGLTSAKFGTRQNSQFQAPTACSHAKWLRYHLLLSVSTLYCTYEGGGHRISGWVRPRDVVQVVEEKETLAPAESCNIEKEYYKYNCFNVLCQT